jgi:hypothetical protein
VDHWEVGDLHAGGPVVVGHVVARHLAGLRPVQLDGDQGIAVVRRIVADGDQVARRAPRLPGGQGIPLVARGEEASSPVQRMASRRFLQNAWVPSS